MACSGTSEMLEAEGKSPEKWAVLEPLFEALGLYSGYG